jgi:hypothetical protein
VRIGFSFFGSIYGKAGKSNQKDYRHCWPNLKKMLIDPYVDKGHEAVIMFSTYRLEDKAMEDEFYETTKVNKVAYSEYEGSTAFRTKHAAFANFEDDDSLDIIIFTRSDLHFRKIMINENIKYDKINFLFPEKGWFDEHAFTCDNFYVFPQRASKTMRYAMEDTFRWPRPATVDTHALVRKLDNYLDRSNFHLISREPEISDVNSFYTCCREGLPAMSEERMKHCHPEVAEKFGYGETK